MKSNLLLSRREAMKNMAILACGLHLNHVLQPLKPFLPSESFIPSAEFIPPIINTPFALGGYFTPDKFRHAIIGNRTGKLHEVFYNPQTGKGTSYLACFDEISCMDSFYTPDDATNTRSLQRRMERFMKSISNPVVLIMIVCHWGLLII